MERTVSVFTPGEALPDTRAVLRSQGVPAGTRLPDRVHRLTDDAMRLYKDLARPRGILCDITPDEFAEVYSGEGGNEPRTPVATIFPQADRLALFAITVGEELSRRIRDLFDINELALAAMLDATASEGAERTVQLLGRRFLAQQHGTEPLTVLSYSPGYCGWHISGQLRLFSHLRPEEIGVTLSSSCLMLPLKSVSGVMVAGRASIHTFDDDFPFCQDCTTRGCRGRMALAKEAVHGPAAADQ